VHELGFRIEVTPAEGFRFFRPDGREVTASGAPPPVGPDPVGTLRAQHHAQGIAIDAATNAVGWDGRPVDYGLVVWSLMPPPEQ
jgi:hypothetical protein